MFRSNSNSLKNPCSRDRRHWDKVTEENDFILFRTPEFQCKINQLDPFRRFDGTPACCRHKQTQSTSSSRR